MKYSLGKLGAISRRANQVPVQSYIPYYRIQQQFIAQKASRASPVKRNRRRHRTYVDELDPFSCADPKPNIEGFSWARRKLAAAEQPAPRSVQSNRIGEASHLDTAWTDPTDSGVLHGR